MAILVTRSSLRGYFISSVERHCLADDGRGLGRRLILAAEQEAVRRRCRLVTLDTYSFQAPEFYRTLGYEVVAVVDGYPTPHRQWYLKKAII
jgi:ribosomal protein S18 acetylase RimI-like enzyme